MSAWLGGLVPGLVTAGAVTAGPFLPPAGSPRATGRCPSCPAAASRGWSRFCSPRGGGPSGAPRERDACTPSTRPSGPRSPRGGRPRSRRARGRGAAGRRRRRRAGGPPRAALWGGLARGRASLAADRRGAPGGPAALPADAGRLGGRPAAPDQHPAARRAGAGVLLSHVASVATTGSTCSRWRGRVPGALERSLLYEAERAARRNAEEAGERLAFLAQASEVLGSSLDYRTTLADRGPAGGAPPGRLVRGGHRRRTAGFGGSPSRTPIRPGSTRSGR